MYNHALQSHVGKDKLEEKYQTSGYTCKLCAKQLKPNAVIGHLCSYHEEECERIIEEAKKECALNSKFEGKIDFDIPNECIFCHSHYDKISDLIAHSLAGHILERERIILRFCNKGNIITCSLCKQYIPSTDSIIGHLSQRHQKEAFLFLQQEQQNKRK